MKKIVIIAMLILAISGGITNSASAHDRHRYHDHRQFADVFTGALIVTMVGNTLVRPCPPPRHQYQQEIYLDNRYSEIEQARMEGYQQARQRELEERRWRAENARQQALENARREGELQYQNRNYRRW